jgi:hypothetical protein
MTTGRSKHRRVLSCFVLLASLSWPCPAQETTALRTAAKELTEALLRSGSKKAAQELAEFGGEGAVRELLERTMQEGGEQLVSKVVRYGEKEGLLALKVIKLAPVKYLSALDSVGAELLTPALRAAAREPEVVTRLITEYGPDALRVAAQHPGVGTKIVSQLGRDGIELADKVSTEDAVRLARWSDDIAQLPPGTKPQVLDVVRAAPAKALDWLDRHPTILLTAAGVTSFLAAKREILGAEGHAGFIERMTKIFLGIVGHPLAVTLYALGAILVLAGAARLAIYLRTAQQAAVVQRKVQQAEMATKIAGPASQAPHGPSTER